MLLEVKLQVLFHQTKDFKRQLVLVRVPNSLFQVQASLRESQKVQERTLLSLLRVSILHLKWQTTSLISTQLGNKQSRQ